MRLRTVTRFFILTLFTLFMSAGASSAKMQWNKDGSVRIYADQGGRMDLYALRYERLRDTGTRITVDGSCNSACTLILNIIPDERVCVTAAADFGFHSIVTITKRGRFVFSREMTDQLMAAYPQPVQDWISRNGGLPNAARTSRMLHLKEAELAQVTGYRRCNASK